MMMMMMTMTMMTEVNKADVLKKKSCKNRLKIDVLNKSSESMKYWDASEAWIVMFYEVNS